MESGDIPDSAISASSFYVTNVGPQNARLRKETAGGAWCPKRQIAKGVQEWLQVELLGGYMVTGVQSQGRYDHGRGQEYVEEYTIEYTRPRLGHWRQYRFWNNDEVLTGNSDTSTVVSHWLFPPIFATQIRILPYSEHRRTVCLRIELMGCRDTSGILSYTMPDSPMPELSDITYDGERKEGILRGGLGRLVDGEIGADNYRIDVGDGRGTAWVAWMRDTFPENYVQIIFEFEGIWIFDTVHIFTNNYFSRDVQVFSKANVWFSYDGLSYDDEPVSYSYIPDVILENARSVSIGLHNRRGRYLKIHLHFATTWIIIGEVTFDGGNSQENTTAESISDFINRQVSINPEIDLNLQTITISGESQGYLEVLIGVLTAIILLLLLVFVIILLLNRRQKLQSSPTVLKNPFGFGINMKGLLLNLTPGGMLGDGVSRVSPDTQEDASMRASLTTEQFDSPLVSPQCKSTYAIVATSESQKDLKTIEISEEAVEMEDAKQVSNTTQSSPPINLPARNSQHYKTLQSYSNYSASRTNAEVGDNQQRDRARAKRWHTAPKEKHKIPAPVVSWNIAPSMSKPYKCKEIEPINIPKHCLRITEKLGSRDIGEAIVCEAINLDTVIPVTPKLVVARVPASTRSRVHGREVKFLSHLSDPNLARVLGVCAAEPTAWTIIEYTELGDLAHYLQYSVPLTSNSLGPSCSVKALSQNCLLYMGMQIASGMKFLESNNLVHKDLAARNCLVGRFYSVKITDIAMCSDLYRKDYSEVGGRPPAPIRWLPWESILLDRYTCSSSVWSFAVTLWEVMSLAREKPFQHLTNKQVIQNAERMYYGAELQVYLPRPRMCPEDVYHVMCCCWRRDEVSRPSFKNIHGFLKNIVADYRP
ncbi:hypothetical protein KM043_013178 [Ampulex compressa]|nr:hypothetical protein KM043_013178 [Ampulex compressa]